MIVFSRIILMVQFLTAIPVPFQPEVDNEDFGKGLAFAPLVGLLIGAILSVTFLLLKIVLPQNLCVVMIILEYIIFTGGLHLDGLGDTFDGLFSNRPKERMLEIMRDSRVGTNAILAIVSVLLINVAFLCEIRGEYIVKTLLLLPVAGRVGSIVGASLSRYARSDEGLGKSFIDYCGKRELLMGIILYSIIFFVVRIHNWAYLFIFPVISAILLIKFFERKIDGATGDVLGAVCELNQTVFLITLYIIFNIK